MKKKIDGHKALIELFNGNALTGNEAFVRDFNVKASGVHTDGLLLQKRDFDLASGANIQNVELGDVRIEKSPSLFDKLGCTIVNDQKGDYQLIGVKEVDPAGVLAENAEPVTAFQSPEKSVLAPKRIPFAVVVPRENFASIGNAQFATLLKSAERSTLLGAEALLLSQVSALTPEAGYTGADSPFTEPDISDFEESFKSLDGLQWLIDPTVAKSMRKVKVEAGDKAKLLEFSGGSYYTATDTPAARTNQAFAKTIALGRWSEAHLVNWGFEVIIDHATLGTSGQIRIVINRIYNVGIADSNQIKIANNVVMH